MPVHATLQVNSAPGGAVMQLGVHESIHRGLYISPQVLRGYVGWLRAQTCRCALATSADEKLITGTVIGLLALRSNQAFVAGWPCKRRDWVATLRLVLLPSSMLVRSLSGSSMCTLQICHGCPQGHRHRRNEPAPATPFAPGPIVEVLRRKNDFVPSTTIGQTGHVNKILCGHLGEAER